jgi:hypothetical protein
MMASPIQLDTTTAPAPMASQLPRAQPTKLSAAPATTNAFASIARPSPGEPTPRTNGGTLPPEIVAWAVAILGPLDVVAERVAFVPRHGLLKALP